MKKLFFVLFMVCVVFTAHGKGVLSKVGIGSASKNVLFTANSADLRAVSADQAIANFNVFTDVAKYLLDNPEQRVLIDGHANPIVGTPVEERDTLRPLSLRRAEAAATFLVDYFDIDRRRIITTGAGGGYPSSNDDPDQNRRVSFVFIPPR